MRILYRLFLVVAGTLAAHAALAQQTDIRIDNRPIGELFDAIEGSTSYRIFTSVSAELDSLRVSVASGSLSVEQIVHRALSGTSFRATVVDNSIFILEGRNIVATLPEYYYAQSTTAVADSLSSTFVLETEDDRGAGSQIRIYNVGDPEATPSGRVTLSGYVYDSATGEAAPGVILQIGHCICLYRTPPISTLLNLFSSCFRFFPRIP